MASIHVASLSTGAPLFENEGGSITALTSVNWPIIDGQRISAQKLVLRPGGVREPHWYTNANELAYCVAGEALVSVFDNGSATSTFTVAPGQMFYVHSGSLHHIENTGDADAVFIIALTNQDPHEFGISAGFGAMTDAVLGDTYGLPTATFTPLVRHTTSTKIGLRQGPAVIPDGVGHVDPHKFDLEGMTPPVASAVGTAKTARQQFWPILDNVSMYAIDITDDGMREPHWHPVTAEMGYVDKGRGRMTILDPDGSVDTYTLEPGDVYFVPAAYPHHIEDVGTDDIHFLIFFDQPTPGDIGYRAALSAFTTPVLQAAFDTGAAVFDELPFTGADPLIVPRVNAVDPVASDA
jgi:oxalate decarboxylase